MLPLHFFVPFPLPFAPIEGHNCDLHRSARQRAEGVASLVFRLLPGLCLCSEFITCCKQARTYFLTCTTIAGKRRKEFSHTLHQMVPAAAANGFYRPGLPSTASTCTQIEREKWTINEGKYERCNTRPVYWVFLHTIRGAPPVYHRTAIGPPSTPPCRGDISSATGGIGKTLGAVAMLRPDSHRMLDRMAAAAIEPAKP